MSTTYGRHKRARQRLKEILAGQALFIHYSCESFYDYSRPASRRITSIAVRSGNTSQTHSFSLHLEAEKLGSLAEINKHLDDCEKAMLSSYYSFVQSHQHGHVWLHWNMRDSNYGFEALDHRFAVLGGRPTPIADPQKVDLSPLLIEIYGKNYTGHPRLTWLVEQNDVHRRAMLSGEGEARAFEDGNFVALHQSTLLKVQALAEIADLAARGKLVHQAKWREIYGSSIADAGEALRDHWMWVLGTTIAGIVLSLVAL